MADNFGVTFAPYQDPSGQNASVTPIQQAIKMISLRIPRVAGAAAPAPAALLNSPGGAGRPDVHSAVLQTILKTIMGGSLPMSDQAPPVSPVGPPPMADPGIAPSPVSDSRPIDPGGVSHIAPPEPAPAPPSTPNPFTPQARDAAPTPSAPPDAPVFQFDPPEAPRSRVDTVDDNPEPAPSLPPPDQREIPMPDDRRRNRQL